MPALREVLGRELRGTVAFVGIGNTAFGDDGIGVAVAERLRELGFRNVWNAGMWPEQYVGALSGVDHVVFVDAVDVGLSPGTIVLLDSAAMRTRYPQVSTHRMSLGLLAQCVEASSGARVWLLGVQPLTTAAGQPLSQPARTAAERIVDSLVSLTARAREVVHA